ncbi:MAG: chromosome partitioning protein ParB [Deltaproteobacteria bacterium]|nr:MAG: chromosome partitioning protein ParB [Deltaproteobacteria bacterium]
MNEVIEDRGVDLSTVEQEPMTDWANEPSIKDLKENIDDAEVDQDTHKNNVLRWLENRAAVRNKTEGQSNVAPKLIRKQAEWRYSSLADPFLSTPDIFNVYPTTSGDIKRARQNQLVLNKQFNTQLNKVKFIDDYVREAVDIGTVIVKLGWATEEEEVTTNVPEYQYMPDDSGMLAEHYMQLMKLRLEDPEAYADHGTPGIDHALDIYQQTGVAMFAKEVGEVSVTKIVETKNQPVLEIPPSENIIIDPSCGGDMSKAIFIGEKFKSSLAELKRDKKYSNLELININTTEDPAVVPNMTDSADIQSFKFKDSARKQFVVYTYWGEWDINGDDTTQQIVCSWVGDVCIRKELNPFPDRRPPFVEAIYMPVRESVFGEPDGELLKDNQDIIGAVTRGAIDLLAKSANSQTGMRKDMLDVTNKRLFKKGSDYEFNAVADPANGVYQHKFPEIPNSVFNMLSLQNNEAESLTGVKDYNSGIDSASLGAVASNAGRALDAAAKRELGILRRLSQGILDVGRKIIAMNAEFLSEKEVVQITDTEFIEVRRDDMAGKFDLRLVISTAEEDAKKAEELAFMLQTAGPNMDLEFSKLIWADIARLRKMPGLAERIEKYKPEPNPIEQARAEKELQLLDAQITKEIALAAKHNADAAAASGRGSKDAAQADLNQAKAAEAGGKARKHNSEADLDDQDYLQKEDGTEHRRDMEAQDRKDGNQIIQEAIKNKQENAK